MVGIALKVLKGLINNFRLIMNSPLSGILHALKRVNHNSLVFMSGYPTLTSLLNCLLNQSLWKSTRMNQNVAAFFGALPFYFYADELSIISHASTVDCFKHFFF